MTLARRLPPKTARRLVRDAGPPNRLAIPALVIGAPLLAIGLVEPSLRLPLFVAGLAILVLPTVLDRDGWRIRLGMAWLAVEQRRRMPADLRLPRTPASADRWLADPRTVDAGMARATALLTAGRGSEARALVAAVQPTTLEEEARVARMMAAIDGLETGRVDARAAEAAIDRLGEPDRRYHALSLAWSAAWVDAMNGRRWQPAFAAASAGVRAEEVPLRFLAWIAIQQLLLPIAGALGVLILWVVLGRIA